MSTRNIREEADRAREALEALADAARQRRADLARERQELAGDRESVLVGARAAMRDVDDEDEVLAEEEAQMRQILGEEIEEEPPAPPATPPHGWNGEEEETPSAPTLPEETPQDDDTVVTPTPTPHVIDVRHWSSLQWLLAFIGLVVGLVVASATYGFDSLTGFGHAVFTTAWFGACAGTGFFGGGWIGALIERHQNS